MLAGVLTLLQGGPEAGGPALAVGFLVVIVPAILGVAALLDLVTGRDDETDAPAGASVRLEAADVQTPGPFVERDAEIEVPPVNLSEPPALVDRVAAGLSGKVASGSEAGLYGNGRGDPVCEVPTLVAFLTDPAKADWARLWAGSLGVAVEDVAGYVGELTEVRLRYDTRVTNHSVVGGEARPFQSVLQAGTAVLVDGHGVPRVRCLCHNPLTEPLPVDGDVDQQQALDAAELAINPDGAWEGFDPAEVVMVEPGDEMDVLVVADLTTGAPSGQPAGSG